MGIMKGRVLVVDDDAALAEMLGIVLRGEGFEPTFVADGDKAMEAFRDFKPDLVLLDLMLPGMDGIDVCRQIRAESGVPIVMLTAKSDTVDVVLGLESGADDYIVKPFKSKVLIARVRARLRRTDDPAPEMLQIGDVSIDVAGHAVTRAGQPLNLDRKSTRPELQSPCNIVCRLLLEKTEIKSTERSFQRGAVSWVARSYTSRSP